MRDSGEHRLDTRLMLIAPDTFHALTRKLCAIDEVKGWWQREKSQVQAVAEQLRRRAVGESQRVFSRLEGTSPAPTGAAAARSRSPDGASYGDVLDDVLRGYEVMVPDEPLVLRLHARLLAHLPESRWHRGKYRSPSTAAGAARWLRADSVALLPTAAHLVPTETRSLLDWVVERTTSSNLHPLLVIAEFVLEFLAIRPFVDGNGRMARLLAQLLLLRCGYTHVACASFDAVVARCWTDYLLLLRRAQASRKLVRPNIAPWLHAFLDIMGEHGRQVQEQLQHVRDEDKLSANQLGVLRLFDRAPEITNRSICRDLGLPRDTAKQVLSRLIYLGIVERAGAGRAVRYRRARSLSARENPDHGYEAR